MNSENTGVRFSFGVACLDKLMSRYAIFSIEDTKITTLLNYKKTFLRIFFISFLQDFAVRF
jgi:hypothetical protein